MEDVLFYADFSLKLLLQ